MYKPRMTGLTTAMCIAILYKMRYEGKTQSTLVVLCPEKYEDKTLMQYLTIFDQLGTTTTYKELYTKDKFDGYLFTIKLKA